MPGFLIKLFFAMAAMGLANQAFEGMSRNSVSVLLVSRSNALVIIVAHSALLSVLAGRNVLSSYPLIQPWFVASATAGANQASFWTSVKFILLVMSVGFIFFILSKSVTAWARFSISFGRNVPSPNPCITFSSFTFVIDWLAHCGISFSSVNFHLAFVVWMVVRLIIRIDVSVFMLNVI